MQRYNLLLPVCLLSVSLLGCHQQRVERHSSENITTTDSPTMTVDPQNQPREGDRRPVSTSTQEQRSAPKIIVE